MSNTRKPRSSSGPAKSADRPVILVVDDQPTVTKAVAVLLRDAGYDPITFAEGSSALSWARQNVAAACVVDIHLPDISGLVLSAKLRELYGDRPIVVLSGDTSMENLKSLSHVGATVFISKPFKAERLVQELRELVPVEEE